MPTMTKCRILQELVERWKGRLHLDRYVISWHWLQGDPGNVIGRAETSETKFKAHLWFDDSEPWVELRNTVIHELLHVWMSPLLQSVSDLAMSPYLPRPAYDMWHVAFSRHNECLTGEMAELLAGIRQWGDKDLEKSWAAVLRRTKGVR